MMSRIHALVLFLGLLLILSIQAQDADFCNFDGIRIPRGASVESNFVTRCGPWEEWPCFCNPDVPYQVDCPYCGFATNTPNLVKCAKHNQTVMLIDLSDDLGKKCTCDASDESNPIGSCVDDFFADKCMFVVDGRTYWYANGDQVDVMNPCGSPSDYPCFCNPNVQGQLYCPYCTVTTRGGNIACLRDEEVKQFNIFRQGGQSSCVCDYSRRDNLNFPAEASCNVPDGCAVEEPNGASTFYSDGDEIQNREGICGNGFPYICDTSGLSVTSDNLKYPYCQFVDQSGEVQCARDGESIFIVDRNGENVRCSCQLESQGAVEDCVPAAPSTPSPTRAPASRPTRAPTAPNQPLSTSAPASPTRPPTTSLSLPPTPRPTARQAPRTSSASPPLHHRTAVISAVGGIVVVLQSFLD